jgi:hypothetical protein
MKSIKVISIREGQPLFDKPIKMLLDQCVVGGALQVLTPLEYISYQQIKWWKGVLLPALSKDSGDSVEYCETKLKLAVMPDEFAPKTVAVGNKEYQIIPSITSLSKKKMNQLIEGSVAKCHEWGLMWATLPDSDLKSTVCSV